MDHSFSELTLSNKKFLEEMIQETFLHGVGWDIRGNKTPEGITKLVYSIHRNTGFFWIIKNTKNEILGLTGVEWINDNLFNGFSSLTYLNIESRGTGLSVASKAFLANTVGELNKSLHCRINKENIRSIKAMNKFLNEYNINTNEIFINSDNDFIVYRLPIIKHTTGNHAHKKDLEILENIKTKQQETKQ